MIFQKSYKREDLLCPWDQVLDRIAVIEKISVRIPVQVKFTVLKDNVVRESSRSPGEKINYGELSSRQKISLAKSLDLAYYFGLVHGDLNRNNILFSSSMCHILDWEPCLFQIRRGRPSWMVTNPWVDPTDRMNRKIGHNTDFLGFWNFLEKPGPNFFHSSTWVRMVQEAMFEIRPFQHLLNRHLLNK